MSSDKQCEHSNFLFVLHRTVQLDIVSLVSFILGSQNPTELESIYSDINSDNFINVLDVVMLVNLILD